MRILRWLLVLPGALLAALVVNFFVLLAYLLTEYLTLQVYGVVSWFAWFDFLFSGVIASGAAGYASITAGTEIAPSNQKVVGKALVVLFTLATVASVLFVYPNLRDGLNGIATIVGVYLGLTRVLEND